MAEEIEKTKSGDKVEKVESTGKTAKPRKTNYEKHLVPCPHCGKDILDHFTECPHCGGKVDPLGYTGDEKKVARVKRITSIIGIILSIGIIAAIIVATYYKSNDSGDTVRPTSHISRTIDWDRLG